MMFIRKTIRNARITKILTVMLVSCMLALSVFSVPTFAEDGTGNELLDFLLEDEDFISSNVTAQHPSEKI